MKGTRNLSKKSAIPASRPKENQRRIKKRTRLSAEGIKDEMGIIDPRQSLRKESMWLYREKMGKRLFKKRGKS